MPQLQLFGKLDSVTMDQLLKVMTPEAEEVLEELKGIFEDAVQNMLDIEDSEFAEGFLAGLLFGRVQMIEADQIAEGYERSPEDRDLILRAHLETALWVLGTRLQQLREAN
jgi:hypothetical protein